MDTVLRLEGISKRFPGVNALTHIDLSVGKGEIHALLGENGAGKSTLMKILSGIYAPDEGRIVLDGETRQFAGYDDAVASGVSIIFQEFSLIPDLDAVEALADERESLWQRLGAASFLDDDEKREAVGYGRRASGKEQS